MEMLHFITYLMQLHSAYTSSAILMAYYHRSRFKRQWTLLEYMIEPRDTTGLGKRINKTIVYHSSYIYIKGFFSLIIIIIIIIIIIQSDSIYAAIYSHL
jgi:hypothetical protein